MKTCAKCGETKPHSEWGKDASRYDGLRRMCKACDRQRAKRQYARTKEARAKYFAQRYVENRAEMVARSKRYRAANAEKIAKYQRQYRQENKAEIRQYTNAWRDKNRERYRELMQRRRAREKANGIFTVTDKDLARLYASPCAACGTTEQVTADHVIPIARGGRHSIGNLQPLCMACNSHKSDRLMVEWRAA